MFLIPPAMRTALLRDRKSSPYDAAGADDGQAGAVALWRGEESEWLGDEELAAVGHWDWYATWMTRTAIGVRLIKDGPYETSPASAPSKSISLVCMKHGHVCPFPMDTRVLYKDERFRQTMSPAVGDIKGGVEAVQDVLLKRTAGFERLKPYSHLTVEYLVASGKWDDLSSEPFLKLAQKKAERDFK